MRSPPALWPPEPEAAALPGRHRPDRRGPAGFGVRANFEILLALRLAAGITGAVVFVTGAGLVTRLAADRVRRRSAVLLGT
ncbi:MAG: hypothetical protein M3Y91_03030 [Actinomycetota bacterium]|nr:hypothetical protein [Actinomycetota bacterium]